MKRDNWDRAQMLLEDIVSELETIESILPTKYYTSIRTNLENIQIYTDSMYSLCENDYCDSSDIELTGYDEMLEMLPNGSNLSLDDMQRLISHIEQWKRGQ